MTYENAYNNLNKAGLIDAIIEEESKKNSPFNLVKMAIISGINYYVDFTSSEAFRNMNYWKDGFNAESCVRRVESTICKALATIEISLQKQNTEMLEYMIENI